MSGVGASSSMGSHLLDQPIVVLEEHLAIARAWAHRVISDPLDLADVIAMLGQATHRA